MQIFQYFRRMLARLFQSKSASRQTIKITMLGSSGVGKTSLLAAIYDQFDKIIGQTNLELIPDGDTRNQLDKRLKDLKSLAGNSIRVRGGIQQDIIPRNFSFDLGRTGVSPSIQLHFQDYPGEYIGADPKPEELKSVESFIRESAAVLLAIDTPAIIEMDGKWHEYINKPEIVYNLFKAAYRNLDSPRLVILAPVKCEKYLQKYRGDTELLTCVKDKYARLLDFFSADTLLPNVAVVVTPVQTVGSVIFSRIEIKDGEPYFYFRKPDPDEPYQPRDSEQPLRYLLRFLLRLYLEKRRVPILDPILSFLGRDAALKEAVREFSNNCKNNIDGFSVLQGESLLKINER